MLNPLREGIRGTLPPRNRITPLQFGAYPTVNLPYRNLYTREPGYGAITGSGFAEFLRTSVATNDASAGVIDRLGPTEELFFRLLNFWHLDHQAGAILLGYGLQGESRIPPIINGVAYLTTRDENDRVAELFQIRKLLQALFRDQDSENSWLREGNEVLENRAPLDLLLEGSMENLLRVRQFVESQRKAYETRRRK